MKSNGSARALLPSSGRTALASPLSSSLSFSSRMSPTSGKKRRRVTDKSHVPSGQSSSRMVSSPHEGFPYAMESVMATTAGMAVLPGHEFLYQLQQLQQQLQQQGMVAAAAAASSNGDEDDASVIQRLEKKDHMTSQLGSFLSQMKQESEGTAAAWKEKLQEISDLKRQLTGVTRQLTVAQDKERETASQLEQVGQEVAAAAQALRESEQTHIEELAIMNEEIKKRQSEADHLEVGYEQSLKDISQELLETQQKQQDAVSRRHALEEALQKMEEGHRMVLTQYDEERGSLRKNLEDLGSHLEVIDREKQELGQHLWNVTQELQQAK